MPEQHQATPEQWAVTEKRGRGDYALSSCIVELRARIEAPEAAQFARIDTSSLCQPVKNITPLNGPKTELHSYKVGPAEPIENWGRGHTLVNPEPAPGAQQLTLVERVQAACDDHPLGKEAPAVIREVAAWLQENPGPNSAWTAVARDLMDEADR